MASAALDHMISLIIFMAAIMIFIGLFSNTMQTGLAYERHNALSTKTSDLLDTILLNPGLPDNWGQSDTSVVGLGLQDPDFNQYKLSSSACMRLASSTQTPIYYPRTASYYSNVTGGFGGYMLASNAKCLNSSTASKLLGINGTYGFQLTLSPTITVSITKISSGQPAQFTVSAVGTGYPLANAPFSYSLVQVKQDANSIPSYTVTNGVGVVDSIGSAQLSFPINGENQVYALIVYTYLDGLKGIGYYLQNPQSSTKNVVPLIDSFQNRNVTLVHSDSVGQPSASPSYSLLSYNASFVILTEEYTLRQVALDQPSAFGSVYNSGSGQNFSSITLPDSDGILIVTCKGTAGQYGLVLMSWGLGSLAFPLTFGGNPAGQEWVTTDLRQVTIGGIAYQAKLELWNLAYTGSG